MTISTIIRIIVTATWLELNLLILFAVRRGGVILRDIRDEARVAHKKADDALDEAALAVNIAETQLEVRGELRNGPIKEEA